MTPEEIIAVVQDHSGLDFNVSLREVDMLKRYFLRKYCKWLSMRQIAVLTGYKDNHHSSVAYAVRVIENDKKFLLIKEAITQKIDRHIGWTLSQMKLINEILKPKYKNI